MRKATRGATLALLALFTLIGAAYAGTDPNDNVAGLQSLARQGIEDIQDLQGAHDDVLAIANALTNDAKFQSDVINAINANDRTALGNLLQQKTSRSTFSLVTLNTSQSFRIECKFKTRKGKEVTVCISSKRTCGAKSDEFFSVD